MRHSPDGGDADDGLTGEVILEAEATEEEVAGVEAELRDVGIDWPVLAALERRGVGDYPWVIMLAAAPDAIFAIFTKKFAELAARTRTGGQELGAAVGVAPTRPRRNHTINDPNSGTIIVLDPELPDEAYRQLQNVDPKRDGGELGYLSWSQEERRWVPPE